MKSSSSICLTIAGLILGHLSLSPSLAIAVTVFSEQEVDPRALIAVARPYANGKYDLLVIEQLPGQRQCWQEIGSNPVTVDPLLLDFDFTGSCERSTDSNGYSLRINGEDLGLDYLFRIVERDGELWLVGSPRRDYSQSEIVVGRTYGIKQGLLKIFLNPGWRMTQRSIGGTLLTHFYFSTQNSNPPISNQKPTVAADNFYNTTKAQPNDPYNTTPPAVKEWKFTAPNSTNRNFSSSLPTQENIKPVSPSLTNLPPPSVESGRKNLSDLLPLPSSTSVASISPVSQPLPSSSFFRVIALTKNSQEQEKIRQIYPDAFPTSYQGVPVMQVGRFGNRANAEFTIETLKEAGLDGRIVQ